MASIIELLMMVSEDGLDLAYLRLNERPAPALYGPSADEPTGIS